jgi:hypothetical protein
MNVAANLRHWYRNRVTAVRLRLWIIRRRKEQMLKTHQAPPALSVSRWFQARRSGQMRQGNGRPLRVRISRMSEKNSERPARRRRLRSEVRPTEATIVFRLRLSDEEMNRLAELAGDDEKKGRFVRDLVLSESTEAPPAGDDGIERTRRLRIRLTPEQDARMNELAAAAGMRSESYCRWRISLGK